MINLIPVIKLLFVMVFIGFGFGSDALRKTPFEIAQDGAPHEDLKTPLCTYLGEDQGCIKRVELPLKVLKEVYSMKSQEGEFILQEMASQEKKITRFYVYKKSHPEVLGSLDYQGMKMLFLFLGVHLPKLSPLTHSLISNKNQLINNYRPLSLYHSFKSESFVLEHLEDLLGDDSFLLVEHQERSSSSQGQFLEVAHQVIFHREFMIYVKISTWKKWGRN